uniref:OsmC family protein n=1 Tax=Cyanothece sp. (strain PCC 7425 / ATCC 29141) TaxID=395961 RepID=B8HSC6_CYAP4
MEMEQGSSLNGVDVSMIEHTVNAIQAQPELAKFKFRLHNTWISGGHNHAQVGNFHGCNQENSHLTALTLEADEPPVLAGTDLGANPVEHLLNALAACLTSTMVYHAAIRGIKIEELESDLEGDIDLRGFLGLSKEVRKGYENIRVNFRVKTAAENLEKLKALSKLSPVFDVTSNGTKVDVQIESQ